MTGELSARDSWAAMSGASPLASFLACLRGFLPGTWASVLSCSHRKGTGGPRREPRVGRGEGPWLLGGAQTQGQGSHPTAAQCVHPGHTLRVGESSNRLKVTRGVR